jgi:hypothetical protein
MAHKFGSLVRIEEKVEQEINRIKEVAKTTTHSLGRMLKKWENWKQTFVPEILKAVDESSVNNGETFLRVNTKAAFTYLSILTSKHDVAVCNPPYTDSSDFGPELKKFINANYKQPFKFNSNLYACFIKRCCELTDETGYVALIHPHTFMFIKSFEDVRKYIIEHTHVDLLVDYGLDNVLSKKRKDEEGIYFNITANQQEKFKKSSLAQIFDDVVNNRKNERAHKLAQSKLKIIDGWPFIYWISGGFREKFKGNSLNKNSNIISGFKTGNNEGALRLWWELNLHETDDNWVKYAKGGPFNKWFGNVWLMLNIKNDFLFVRKQNSFNIPNEEYLYKEGITYNGSGSKGVSFRLLESDTFYDMGSSAIFCDNPISLISILNTKLIYYITDCLNPTVNKQPNDIERIPFVKPSKEFEEIISALASQNIEILNSYRIIETNFDKNPLTAFSEPALRDRLLAYLNYENAQSTLVLLNEAIINQLIFEVYDLSPEDREQVENKMGKPVGELPVLAETKDAYLSATVIDNEAVKEFIQNLAATTYEEQHIQAIKAELATLYRSNNDLEEFCIRNQASEIRSIPLMSGTGSKKTKLFQNSA